MALRKLQPGFRMNKGEDFNPLIDAVNSITGASTPTLPGNFTTGSFSGAASFAAGTAALPSLTFTGDVDTGFYRKAANQVGVAANGSMVGYFASTGWVGPVVGAVTGNVTGNVDGILGGTTPAAATVTTLAASGAVNLAGANVALSSLTTGLTAFAGGGQASALQLAAMVNIITTVATAADSVKLPQPSVAGQLCIVSNQAAANSMQVYGSGTATINGVATGTGVAVASKKTAIFVAITTGAAGTWAMLLSA